MGAGFQPTLDERSGVPIYRQILEQIGAAIADGRLGVGDQLPTVRGLAVDLRINPNTVARAYHDLELTGFLEMRRGLGTFVSGHAPRPDPAERAKRLRQLGTEVLAHAGDLGFTLSELIDHLETRRREAQEAARERDNERRTG